MQLDVQELEVMESLLRLGEKVIVWTHPELDLQIVRFSIGRYTWASVQYPDEHDVQNAYIEFHFPTQKTTAGVFWGRDWTTVQMRMRNFAFNTLRDDFLKDSGFRLRFRTIQGA